VRLVCGIVDLDYGIEVSTGFDQNKNGMLLVDMTNPNYTWEDKIYHQNLLVVTKLILKIYFCDDFKDIKII